MNQYFKKDENIFLKTPKLKFDSNATRRDACITLKMDAGKLPAFPVDNAGKIYFLTYRVFVDFNLKLPLEISM